MKPHVRTGLIVGAIGLPVNIVVSALLGLCGPVVALIAGAVAGVIAAGKGAAASRSDATRNGALAAALAGLLTEMGQLIGGVGLMVVARSLQWDLPFGAIPGAGAPAEAVAGYWLGGILASGCFGLLGLLLAIGAGALAAYLRTPSSAPVPVQTQGDPGQPV